MTHWKHSGNIVENIDHFPENSYGFIYKITNLENGLIYIGRKILRNTRTIKKGKRELAKMTDKRGSVKKTVVKESNWAHYNGSCKPLLSDIKKGDRMDRQILKICNCKASMTYWESKFQFCEEVLEKPSYNENILGKIYRKNIFCKDA